MPRALLSAGDLLRTAQALGVADPPTLALLARQLGLAMAPVAGGAALPAQRSDASGTSRRPRAPTTPPVKLRQRRAGDGRQQTATDATGASVTDDTGGSPVQALLQPLPAQTALAAPPPPWLAPGAPALAKGPVSPRSPHDPLFNPASARALGAAVAATRVADGDPDIPLLVDRLASGEPLRSLPRRPVWTLRNGLQVLVDQAPGMQPWQPDVQQLLDQLARLLGVERLQVLGFEGEPLQGCWAEGADQPGRWPLPPTGTPVLLLSDLGISRPPGTLLHGTARRWQPFARAAAQAGASVRLLVPFAPARWPAGLPPAWRVLCWHRPATVAAVRRLLAA